MTEDMTDGCASDHEVCSVSTTSFSHFQFLSEAVTLLSMDFDVLNHSFEYSFAFYEEVASRSQSSITTGKMPSAKIKSSRRIISWLKHNKYKTRVTKAPHANPAPKAQKLGSISPASIGCDKTYNRLKKGGPQKKLGSGETGCNGAAQNTQ